MLSLECIEKCGCLVKRRRELTGYSILLQWRLGKGEWGLIPTRLREFAKTWDTLPQNHDRQKIFLAVFLFTWENYFDAAAVHFGDQSVKMDIAMIAVFLVSGGGFD